MLDLEGHTEVHLSLDRGNSLLSATPPRSTPFFYKFEISCVFCVLFDSMPHLFPISALSAGFLLLVFFFPPHRKDNSLGYSGRLSIPEMGIVRIKCK